MKHGKPFSIILIALIATLVLIQLIPVTRDNPAAKGDFSGPTDVKQILKQSCYDCHSNETVWPWYSHIAPVSWLVVGDVNEARHHFNFSNWQLLSDIDKIAVKREIWKEIDSGEMPPETYLLMHSDAKLSETDKALIYSWTVAQSPEPDSTK